AHEGVARLQQRQEHGLVHLAAGVRLNISEFAVEELLGALDGEFLDDVDELAAAVVALARIAFRILVGQDRTLRLENGARDDVFRGDQLDLVALATELLADCRKDFRIALFERLGEESGSICRRCGSNGHGPVLRTYLGWRGCGAISTLPGMRPCTT